MSLPTPASHSRLASPRMKQDLGSCSGLSQGSSGLSQGSSLAGGPAPADLWAGAPHLRAKVF